jgi:membrane fusion protein (multidrug efflux system)
MRKRIIATIIGLLIVVALLGGVKGFQINRMIAHGSKSVPPPETVTTIVAQTDSWESRLAAVGSLAAVQGVMVTAELTGKVVQIAFEPGTKVNSGDLLVKQDTSSEAAQLRAAEANVALTRLNLDRLKKLLNQRTIAQSQYDNAEAQYKEGVAQADAIRTIIAKKNIQAPFAGRLGIRLVNLGQILHEGDSIVSLQSIDPIFVNFSLPQQYLAQVQTGLTVRVVSDALPGQVIEGKITAINPEVDTATRNIRIQATVTNHQEHLRPGMFVNVAVVMPDSKNVLAVPATAVLYAPYSDSVFVVEEKQNENTKQPGLVVRQRVLKLGEKRGDFIAVVSGLEPGETIVSTGAFKLRDGQAVAVDNNLAPEFKLAPEPGNS